jgi:hypothetical protein
MYVLHYNRQFVHPCLNTQAGLHTEVDEQKKLEDMDFFS